MSDSDLNAGVGGWVGGWGRISDLGLMRFNLGLVGGARGKEQNRNQMRLNIRVHM